MRHGRQTRAEGQGLNNALYKEWNNTTGQYYKK